MSNVNIIRPLLANHLFALCFDIFNAGIHGIQPFLYRQFFHFEYFAHTWFSRILFSQYFVTHANEIWIVVCLKKFAFFSFGAAFLMKIFDFNEGKKCLEVFTLNWFKYLFTDFSHFCYDWKYNQHDYRNRFSYLFAHTRFHYIIPLHIQDSITFICFLISLSQKNGGKNEGKMEEK